MLIDAVFSLETKRLPRESKTTPDVPAPGIVNDGVDDAVIGCVKTTKPLSKSATNSLAGGGGGMDITGFFAHPAASTSADSAKSQKRFTRPSTSSEEIYA